VLHQLAVHGVAPRPDTPPQIVREFINDLYVYEIRRLKARLRAGEFPMSEYANRVDQLRRRYPVLSLPLEYWTD
jgi:hypothetical protein